MSNTNTVVIRNTETVVYVPVVPINNYIVRREPHEEPAKLGEGGCFRMKVWTKNGYDGNLTEGMANVCYEKNGTLHGSVDYSAGSGYNVAELAPIIGYWKT